MKILKRENIQAWDNYTIKNEPIKSIDLMERAAKSFVKILKNLVELSSSSVIIICGPGNNGGDGLAIARLIASKVKIVRVCISVETEKYSEDFRKNLKALDQNRDIIISNFSELNKFFIGEDNTIIIDALFGSGLTRPVTNQYAEIIHLINFQSCPVISIDLPSGMYCDTVLEGPCIQADHTISFQAPKLAFYFAENLEYLGNIHICHIGLDADYYKKLSSEFYQLEPEEAQKLYKPRKQNVHKNEVGKAYLIAGKRGMIGASILAAKACLRAGTGSLTVHIPESGLQILQQQVPEAICSIDSNFDCISEINIKSEYSAFGIGPGIGMQASTVNALKSFMRENNKIKTVVFDADALNIIAENPAMLDLLKSLSFILTPHIGEFDRLFGHSKNSHERFIKLKEAAILLQGVIILKGPRTAIGLPNGQIIYNTTGNQGMATAGSGDVLTGIILALLSQGYSIQESAKLGVFMHGMAGDLAVQKYSIPGMIASDLIEKIPDTFLWLQGRT